PPNAQFRIGLSATPIRHYDEVGTQSLRDYFGDDVIVYGIADAILDKALTPYFYYPMMVELTDDEMAEYRDITDRLSKCFGREPTIERNDPVVKALLIKRSRLIAGAENKLSVLRQL